MSGTVRDTGDKTVSETDSQETYILMGVGSYYVKKCQVVVCAMKENKKADNKWHVVWEAELEWSTWVSQSWWPLGQNLIEIRKSHGEIWRKSVLDRDECRVVHCIVHVCSVSSRKYLGRGFIFKTPWELLGVNSDNQEMGKHIKEKQCGRVSESSVTFDLNTGLENHLRGLWTFSLSLNLRFMGSQ